MELNLTLPDQPWTYYFRPLAYEFLGSALLTWAYTLSGQDPLARGAAYLFVYLMAAEISGAHCNPAVSVAIFIKEKARMKENAKYLGYVIFAQIIGAFSGLLVTYLLAKDHTSHSLYPETRPVDLYIYEDTISGDKN